MGLGNWLRAPDTDGAVIEPADSRDIPALTALLGELFAREHDFADRNEARAARQGWRACGFTPDPEKQARALRLILAHPEKGRLFVVRMDGKVVGMANALFTISTAEGGPVVLLEDVILSAPYRGQGLGRRLVEHVMDWARGEGFLRVTLLTDADNQGAQQFYGRLGFTLSKMLVLRLPLDGVSDYS
jgi:GNAT superfamily N-acetyltransferase